MMREHREEWKGRPRSGGRVRSGLWVMGCALLAAGSARAAAPAASPADTGLTFVRFLDDFAALAPDPGQGAHVPAFTLRREAGVIRFDPGTIHLCAPVAGRVCAAVYTGRGVFGMRPPTPVEREQLERVCDTDSLAEEFSAAVLVFGDSTLAELRAQARFGPAAPAEAAKLAAAECVRYLFGPEKKQRDLDPVVAKSLAEGGPDGMFYAHFVRVKGDPVFFEIDPRASEEVRYLRRPVDDKQAFLQGRGREVVSQFPREGQLTSDPPADARASLDARRYVVDARIEDDLEFSATAVVELVSLEEGQRWLPFLLCDELAVDSAAVDGAAVSFFKGEKSPRLWIRADRPLARGQPLALRLRYHGRLLERDADWITLKSSTGWYPQHDGKDRALFDLTFHVPSQFQFASIGRRAESAKQGNVVTSRWVTARPVRNASFNLGFFKELEVRDPRIPPVLVQMSSVGHRELAEELGKEGITSGSAMDKQVAADVANSLAFFSGLYGPPPDSSAIATEIPGGHGEAFPGLVHLSWITFQRTGSSGADQLFRAHEVAHQWWAIGVDYKTYHDQWLSEAFAQYSGLWYMQAALNDNRRFFAMLEEWRERVMSNRRYLLGSGQEAGPIWLGRRTSMSSTRGDYGLIIYQKGAWVLHMLRNMLLDLDTMSDDRFTRLMRDFYTTCREGAASTADFQFLAEKHVGQSLDWFFDQWVYGTDVPTYRFAWQAAPADGGKFKLRCRVEQAGVPATFRMYVPVAIGFAGDKVARIRVLVQGPKTEFEVPVPMEPRKVVFNDLASVLCEAQSVPW